MCGLNRAFSINTIIFELPLHEQVTFSSLVLKRSFAFTLPTTRYVSGTSESNYSVVELTMMYGVKRFVELCASKFERKQITFLSVVTDLKWRSSRLSNSGLSVRLLRIPC